MLWKTLMRTPYTHTMPILLVTIWAVAALCYFPFPSVEIIQVLPCFMPIIIPVFRCHCWVILWVYTTPANQQIFPCHLPGNEWSSWSIWAMMGIFNLLMKSSYQKVFQCMIKFQHLLFCSVLSAFYCFQWKRCCMTPMHWRLVQLFTL